MARNLRIFSFALTLALFASAPLAMAAGGTGPDPLHNYTNPVDVDGNGLVTPRDVLLIINELQRLQGSSNSVSAITATIDLSSAASTGSGGSQSDESFDWDTNADGIISPFDALLVINHLNQVPEPSTMVMSGLAALIFGGYLWRRKRAGA